MIKFFFFALLVFLIMRVIARIFAVPGQTAKNQQSAKFYVYRDGSGLGQTQIKKEKDISEKGRILED